jgi:pimeloyl-ACP methyl ester carboxylesterase
LPHVRCKTEGKTMQSIHEGLFAAINGTEQWLTFRGADRANPALLIVGGPGFGYAALAPLFAGWEHAFTLVQWDQPGAGFTFARSGREVASLEQLVADGLVAAERACARLGVRKLALLCFSAGTIVGLEMVQRRPELFAAYVGSGQVVDWARQDALGYELLLARARATRNETMLAELTAIGAPPYADAAADAVKSKYAAAPTMREAAAFGEFASVAAAALQGVPADATYLAHGVPWPEPRARSLAAYTALRAAIVGFDARRLGLTFDVPMVFLQGVDDVFTVSAEVERYAGQLVAPNVAYVPIPEAGHAAMLLRHEMLGLLRRHVAPLLGVV